MSIGAASDLMVHGRLAVVVHGSDVSGKTELPSFIFGPGISLPLHLWNILSLCCYPHESKGICFYWRWFVCLSVTTVTKRIVDGFVPNFIGRFLGGKGRPSSCFVMIGRGMWK